MAPVSASICPPFRPGGLIGLLPATLVLVGSFLLGACGEPSRLGLESESGSGGAGPSQDLTFYVSHFSIDRYWKGEQSATVHGARILGRLEFQEIGGALHVVFEPALVGSDDEALAEGLLTGFDGDIRQSRVFRGRDPDPSPLSLIDRYLMSGDLSDPFSEVRVWKIDNWDDFSTGLGLRLLVERGTVTQFGFASIASQQTHFTLCPWEIEAMYLEALAVFVEREGHSVVPLGHLEAGVDLGQGVAGFKRLHSKGWLEPSIEEQLVSLPGWYWWEYDEVELIELYVAEHGHLCIPADYVAEDRRIGEWIEYQVLNYRMVDGDPIHWHDPETWSRLEAVPGWAALIDSGCPER